MLGGSVEDGVAEIALERSLIDAGALDECVRAQQEAASRGESVTLADLLLRRNLINAGVLSQLMAEVRRRMDGIPSLPRYEILESLGEGGAARVYRARDRELGREVALKVLRPQTQLSEGARERFLREARLASGVSHPNLVTVYDAGEAEGVPYLVMERVDGDPLSRRLEEGGLGPEERVPLILKVAQGVAEAHAQQIVHRDLKPANILVTRGGEPKVADFGLAFAAGTETRLTRTGATLGTPLYMAPEQVEGAPEDLGPPTDVYALGAILYEVLTGRPPHTGRSAMEIYRRIVIDDPVPPRKLNARVDGDLEAVCLKALEKRPSDRYPTAAEFADDLARHLSGEPVRAKPSGPVARGWKFLRRRPAVAAAAGILAASALLLLWAASGKPPLDPAQERILSEKLAIFQGELGRWESSGGDGSPYRSLLAAYERLYAEGKYRDAEGTLDEALMGLSIDRKRASLEQAVAQMKGAGLDAAPLEGLLNQFEQERDSGNLGKANATLERALTLIQIAPGTSPGHQRLQMKRQQVMEKRRRWQEAGHDFTLVAEMMAEFEMLLQKGKHAEAERVLDRMLAIEPPLGNALDTAPPAVRRFLQEKMRRVQQSMRARQQSGRPPPEGVGPVMQQFQTLMRQSRFGEAEAALDRILKHLGEGN